MPRYRGALCKRAAAASGTQDPTNGSQWVCKALAVCTQRRFYVRCLWGEVPWLPPGPKGSENKGHGQRPGFPIGTAGVGGQVILGRGGCPACVGWASASPALPTGSYEHVPPRLWQQQCLRAVPDAPVENHCPKGENSCVVPWVTLGISFLRYYFSFLHLGYFLLMANRFRVSRLLLFLCK